MTKEHEWGLSVQTAHRIFSVLIEYAGAVEQDRGDFIRYHYMLKAESSPSEYRCCRAFGFGGKFRRNYAEWYVDAYQEDVTDDRRKKIHAANIALIALRNEISAAGGSV